MSSLPIEEFVEKFNFYRRCNGQVTSIERALEDLRIKYAYSEEEIGEIREYVLDIMEPEE